MEWKLSVFWCIIEKKLGDIQMNDLIVDELKESILPDGDNIIEILVGFITKDPVVFIKEIKRMISMPTSVKDALFWNNFLNFLSEGKFSYEMLHKLSEKLEEEEDSRSSAIKIVESISKIDEPIKARYIANLTQSFINGQIDKLNYFRLVNTINSLIGDDLRYIADNVEYSGTIISDLHIDDFVSTGIMRNIEGGYCYTERAYDLVEFGINKGHNIKRPGHIPERMIISTEAENIMFDDYFTK